MTDSVPRAHDTIERLYESSVAQDGWQACFDLLCAQTGAIGALFCSLSDPLNAIVSASLHEVNRLYRQKWWRDDIFLELALGREPVNGFVPHTSFDGEIDRSTHPFFADFLHGHGLGAFVAYFSPVIFGARFILTLQRSAAAGPFSPDEMAALEVLAPHAARALAISGQLQVAQSRDQALLSILDKLTYGAMIVGAQGRIKARNESADRMLGDGLMLHDGRVVETYTNPRGMVDRLVKLALADTAGRSKNALIHRPSGRKPIVLQALSFPLSSTRWEAVHQSETTLLMLIDTESAASVSQLSVVQSFGLTSAEARVATLVGSGFSPIEAAEQLGSAAGTVRVQLKNVFNKLDLKRQSELVRLMTKLEVLGS